MQRQRIESSKGELTIVGLDQVIVQERFIIVQVALGMAVLHASHGSGSVCVDL